MTQLLNNLNLSGNISKLVEFPDELAINAQIYDKTTFSPKPLRFCPLRTSSFNELITSKIAYFDHVSSYICRSTNNLLVDNNNPNIWYVSNPGSLTATIGSIHKITKNSNGTYTILDWSFTSPTGGGHIAEIIGQTANNIFVLYKRGYINNSIYIYTIDKQTMTLSLAGVNPDGYNSKFLRETENFMYFSVSHLSTNTLSILKWNKTSNATTIVYADSLSGFVMNQNTTDIESDGTIYAVKDMVSVTGTNTIGLRRYQINTNTDAVTMNTVNLNLDILPSNSIPVSTNSNTLAHDLFLFKDDGKTYLSLAIYNASKTLTIPNEAYALYTFLLETPNNAKLIDYKILAPFTVSSVLPMYNNKLLIMGSTSGLRFYSWNRPNQKFEVVSDFMHPIILVGADTNNNIYIQQNNGSVEMYSNTIPINIYVDFVEQEYQFQGEETTTEIELYAKNYLGDFISSSLEIILSGPVKFTDTGLKTKTVTTSNLNKMSQTVTITGQGLIKANYRTL